MTSITAPAYDPINTATTMAQKSTAAAQQLIDSQTKNATATAKALSTLGSALSAFQTSLTSLAGIGKSMLAQSATLSDTTVGTATAKPTAAAGSYSLVVDKLATASQMTYDVADAPVPTSPLTIMLSPDGVTPTVPSFTVDLSHLRAAGDTRPITPREVATAINQATGNNGQVTAGVATINGVAQLVVTSKMTGADYQVSVTSSATTDSNGNAVPAYSLGAHPPLVVGQDAEFYFGGRGTPVIKQPTNTFTAIDGVTFTATRAQAASENPFTLTVGSDSGGTTSNVQAFVDAYNKLKTAVDNAVDPGDAATSKTAGAFAHDSGIKALQSRLVSLLRSTGSPSLANYGIMAARDGTLTLDTKILNKQLAINPDGLDTLIGTASASNPTGVAGALYKYVDKWADGVSGQIKKRSDANASLQATLTKRQTTVQNQYDAAYDHYLKQFTALQTLQSTMNSNVSMFDAMFSSDKSS